jgi:hypothetical protein
MHVYQRERSRIGPQAGSQIDPKYVAKHVAKYVLTKPLLAHPRRGMWPTLGNSSTFETGGFSWEGTLNLQKCIHPAALLKRLVESHHQVLFVESLFQPRRY